MRLISIFVFTLSISHSSLAAHLQGDEKVRYKQTYASWIACRGPRDFKTEENESTKDTFHPSGMFLLPDGTLYSGPSYFYKNHQSVGLIYRPLPVRVDTGKLQFLFGRDSRLPAKWFPDQNFLSKIVAECAVENKERLTVPAGEFDTCKFEFSGASDREHSYVWIGNVTLGVVKYQVYFCNHLVQEDVLIEENSRH